MDAVASAESGRSVDAPSDSAEPVYVYALGKIEPRFPNLGVEKEFAQAIGRADTTGLTDQQAMYEVLRKSENRYLVRMLTWILTIGGIDTYLLVPRDPVDFALLAEAIRAEPNAQNLDVVIGQRGPLASSGINHGLTLPVVAFDQIYSFDTKALIEAIPRPKGIPADRFHPAAESLFGRLIQLADNTGSADKHRALNYLAVRYPAIYEATARAYAGNAGLTAVRVQDSRLSPTRKIVDVIFTYTHRETDVSESSFVRVDVSDEFPFLVSKFSPYFER